MLTKECGSAGRRHLPGNGRRGECMGKREDSDSARGGWRDAEYKKIVGEEGI